LNVNLFETRSLTSFFDWHFCILLNLTTAFVEFTSSGELSIVKPN